MSGDDRELIDRLLDAARQDVAPDEAARQTKIYERVVTAGGGGGGGASGPLTTRGWAGVTVAAVGALAIVGATVLAITGGASNARGPHATDGTSGSSADAPPLVSEPAPPESSSPRALGVTAPTSIGTPPTSIGTSVWELPSVSTPASEKPAASVAAPSDDLALELAALEKARRKLRDREPAAAMALLDEFDRRFPRPRAGEEATVLRVEVLFGLGRADDARRLGRDFVARRPDSIYRARVVQLLGDAAP